MEKPLTQLDRNNPQHAYKAGVIRGLDMAVEIIGTGYARAALQAPITPQMTNLAEAFIEALQGAQEALLSDWGWEHLGEEEQS